MTLWFEKIFFSEHGCHGFLCVYGDGFSFNDVTSFFFFFYVKEVAGIYYLI